MVALVATEKGRFGSDTHNIKPIPSENICQFAFYAIGDCQIMLTITCKR